MKQRSRRPKGRLGKRHGSPLPAAGKQLNRPHTKRSPEPRKAVVVDQNPGENRRMADSLPVANYVGSFGEVIMREVQLRDAKAKLSALVEEAARGETAVITRRGKPQAVIVGIDAWDRLRHVPSFGRLLLSAPLDDADLPSRDGTLTRNTTL